MNEKTAVNRKKVGKSVQYLNDKTEIKAGSEFDYFMSLRIPPAWQNGQKGCQKTC